MTKKQYSVTIDQEISGSIPGSAMGIFSSAELFHGVYGLAASEFQHPLAVFCPALPSEEVNFFISMIILKTNL